MKAKKTRGGARPNSGPKPKPKAPPIENPGHSGLSAQELAKQHLDLAIATLSHLAAVGVSETARVAAAKAIVEIARGDSASVALGKKDQLQADADNAGRGSVWEDDLEFSGGRPN